MVSICKECLKSIKDNDTNKVILAGLPFGAFCNMDCAKKFLQEYGPKNNDYWPVD